MYLTLNFVYVKYIGLLRFPCQSTVRHAWDVLVNDIGVAKFKWLPFLEGVKMYRHIIICRWALAEGPWLLESNSQVNLLVLIEHDCSIFIKYHHLRHSLNILISSHNIFIKYILMMMAVHRRSAPWQHRMHRNRVIILVLLTMTELQRKKSHTQSTCQ